MYIDIRTLNRFSLSFFMLHAFIVQAGEHRIAIHVCELICIHSENVKYIDFLDTKWADEYFVRVETV